MERERDPGGKRILVSALGPTTPVGVPAGETVDIVLPADGEIFEKWSAHPEVG